MKFIKSFKFLSAYLAILTSLLLPQLVLAQVAAQPTTIVLTPGVRSTTTYPRKVSELNKISWGTPYVYLQADSFYILIDGKKYYGKTNVSLHSDPPDSPYTTLEAIWQENGVEMRLFLYFKSAPDFWKLYEIRTYNGKNPGDWIYYKPTDQFGQTIQNVMGESYINNASPLEFKSLNEGEGLIHFENISLRPFTSYPQITPITTPIELIPISTTPVVTTPQASNEELINRISNLENQLSKTQKRLDTLEQTVGNILGWIRSVFPFFK